MAEEPENTESEKKGEEPQITIDSFPNSPDFLGDNNRYKYPLFPRSRFRIRRIKIDDIYTELNRSNRRSIINPKIRDKLTSLLEKYPDSAELNALDAIKRHSDLRQSSSTDRFQIIESIVKTLGKTINSYPYCVNTVNWFFPLFSQYLDQLRIANAKKGYRVQEMGFYHAKKQILALRKLNDKSTREFERFIRKFHSSSFYANIIDEGEIREALKNVTDGNPEAEVGKLRTPSFILQNVYLKTNLSLSRVPIFSARVQQSLDDFKDIEGKEMYLQRAMIETTKLLSDYMFEANKEGATEKSNLKFLSTILKKCKGSIDKIPSSQKELRKEYEYDPFIKFGTITLSISNFNIDRETKITYLKKAEEYLDRVKTSCTDATGVKQSARLTNKIHQTLFRYSVEKKSDEESETENPSAN